MDELANEETTADPSRWVDEYGDFLYRFAMSRLRSPEAAEEVVQETFFAALKALDQYAGRGAERAWLLGILKRKVVDVIRQRSRSKTVADDGDDLSEQLFDQKGSWRSDPRVFGPRPAAALESAEFWDAFRNCLETVPQRQADAFALRELDGKPGEEVCKDLEITPSNLWVLLYRARMRLANCMKVRWQEAGAG